jgi:hypothetical protein
MVVERGSFARNVLNSVYGCHFGVSNDKLLCAGGRIEIRSRFGGDLQSLPPENFDISSAIFSPDGSRLAQVERDGVVVVTDSITGDDLWWKKAPADLHFYTTSGDGQTLYARDATASYAVAWDGKSEIRSHPNLLAVGFDGRRIAVLDHWLDVPRANPNGSEIHIRASGPEIDEATLSPSFAPESAAFVNRDKALAHATTRGDPGAVMEIATGKVLYPLPPRAFLYASPGGGCLAIMAPNRLQILDAATACRRDAQARGGMIEALRKHSGGTARPGRDATRD